MSDNQANPLKGAETDVSKAADSILGLLTPNNEAPKEEEDKKIQQNSPELQNEESSNEDQPQEQEIKEEETEVESQDETEEETSEDVSQDEEQIDTQEKQDSTYNVKVAGQEFEVTLDELRNGYQRDADYRRKTEELSLDRKDFQSESEKQKLDYSNRLNELNNLVSTTQQQLTDETNNVDLEQLYEDDPSEAMKVEHKLRRKQEKLNLAMQKVQSEQKIQFDSYLQDQQNKLTNKMPEFSDPTKASSLKNNMRNFLSSHGFNNQEVGQIYDHRIIMLVNEAMKYRNLQNSKPNLAKKISKPSRPFSSGVKKDANDISLSKRKEKFSRLKRSGSQKDATSIFLDMINNSNK